MNHSLEENTSDLAPNHARHMTVPVLRDDLQSRGAVNICENCQQTCERLNDVPEFRFRGCDRCYDEAMEIMEKETTELLKTPPAACGSDHKSVHGDLVPSSPLAVEGKVA
jgi:hypothetical protein